MIEKKREKESEYEILKLNKIKMDTFKKGVSGLQI